MKKFDYFINALNSKTFKIRSWVFSIFSIVREEENKWKENPFPYRLVKQKDGYYFVNPEATDQLIKIDDGNPSLPLINAAESIRVGYTAARNMPTIRMAFETTYGNMFFNHCVLIYAFDNKIEYQHGRISAKKLENIIASLLTDNKEDISRDPSKIYIDEYIKYCDAMFYLAEFSQLWVPGATEKMLSTHPDMEKLKAKLLEENKNNLHDPAVIASIEKKLVELDTEWLKGDVSEGFLISNKTRNIVRKKLYLMYGAEPGLEEKIEVDAITNSLEKGWDITKFPSMNNALRAGSFNRGAQTMLGGEAVKWLLRSSSNLRIASDDCKTKLGIPIILTEDNYKTYLQRYIVGDKDPILLTEDNIKSLINKKVLIRSPMFCKLDKTDYCSKCCGEKLSIHPTGLSIAVSDYGSNFLYIFMSGAHSKGLETAKLDLSKQLF